jgi:hypothetical protein
MLSATFQFSFFATDNKCSYIGGKWGRQDAGGVIYKYLQPVVTTEMWEGLNAKLLPICPPASGPDVHVSFLSS